MKSNAIITLDATMKKILQILDNVAPSKAAVLITGESGTGKELLARYLHAKSPRAERKMIAVNCAAVPEGLMESELFGHEKGAFTGAIQSKPGKFELANKSTLLLDEIGEMPLLLQTKLLRALQENEIERVGGKSTLPVDVRIVAATNKDLKQLVKKGMFREDLFYRLNVIPVHIPPLRNRVSDLKMLTHHFVESACILNGMSIKKISGDALEKIMKWGWPGNVRELQNIIERAVLLCASDEIDENHLEINSEGFDIKSLPFTPGMTLDEVEKFLILKTLEFTEENRTHAAKILGISIRTLRNKLNEYSHKNKEQDYEQSV